MFASSLDYLKKRPAIALTAGLLFGAGIAWVFIKSSHPLLRAACVRILESGEDRAERSVGRVVSVDAETVKVGVMTRRVASVGKLRANASVRIRSEMAGRIKDILFAEGASIKKGEEILKFVDGEQKGNLMQAEAEVILKQAEFERAKKLHDEKVGSTKDYGRALAEYKAAEGRLESAKAVLDRTVICAPFEGTLGIADVSVGAYIQAGQELITIVDSTPIKVDFKIPEKYIHDVGVGQVAEIRIDAMKDRIFYATVEAVDVTVESESHSVLVRASIPNEDNLLKPGMFANVSLIIAQKGETITIAESALDREGEIEFVWIVEKGRASRKRILSGVRENSRVEVIAGLKAGAVVVVAGQLKLQDGVRVKINQAQTEVKESTEKLT